MEKLGVSVPGGKSSKCKGHGAGAGLIYSRARRPGVLEERKLREYNRGNNQKIFEASP